MIGPGSRTAWYVQVARANGFAGPVKVEVRGLPAGVTVNPLTIPANVTQGLLVVSAVDGKSKTLLGTGSTGHVTLKAAPDAPECTDVPVCVQGFVAINFVVKIGYASEVIWVSVKK